MYTKIDVVSLLWCNQLPLKTDFKQNYTLYYRSKKGELSFWLVKSIYQLWLYGAVL